jgi:hypothetical protein
LTTDTTDRIITLGNHPLEMLLFDFLQELISYMDAETESMLLDLCHLRQVCCLQGA